MEVKVSSTCSPSRVNCSVIFGGMEEVARYERRGACVLDADVDWTLLCPNVG